MVYMAKKAPKPLPDLFIFNTTLALRFPNNGKPEQVAEQLRWKCAG